MLGSDVHLHGICKMQLFKFIASICKMLLLKSLLQLCNFSCFINVIFYQKVKLLLVKCILEAAELLLLENCNLSVQYCKQLDLWLDSGSVFHLVSLDYLRHTLALSSYLRTAQMSQLMSQIDQSLFSFTEFSCCLKFIVFSCSTEVKLEQEKTMNFNQQLKVSKTKKTLVS